jgi:hypothetical protein
MAKTVPAEVRVSMAHQYLSTSCLHGQLDGNPELHAYCQSATGSNGTDEWAKTPASCKHCGTPCVCPCHGAVSDEDRIRDAMTEAQARPGRTITR